MKHRCEREIEKVRMCDVCWWRLCSLHLNSITKSHLPPTFIEFRLIEYIYMISLFGSFWCFVDFSSRQFCHSLFIQTHIHTIRQCHGIARYGLVWYGMVWCMYIFCSLPNAIQTHTYTHYLVKFSEIISQSADREKFLRSFVRSTFVECEDF